MHSTGLLQLALIPLINFQFKVMGRNSGFFKVFYLASSTRQTLSQIYPHSNLNSKLNCSSVLRVYIESMMNLSIFFFQFSWIPVLRTPAVSGTDVVLDPFTIHVRDLCNGEDDR